MHIIDRRLNPSGKSLVNRQRFLRRARAAVQRAVRESTKNRSIKDIDRESEISIDRSGIHEPTLHRASTGGTRERVLPGNRKYLEGDRISRGSEGSGAGSGNAGEGDDNDDFQFVLTREEFLDLFLDDLELPDLVKRKLIGTEVEGIRRAGYTTAGSPANLSIPRTMQKALSRRLALRRPSSADLRRIEQEIAEIEARTPLTPEDRERLEALQAEGALIRRRRSLIAYIDPVDLRYRRFEPVPKPISRAVMFCLMDVSGSMSEHMKDLAKRFFTLLYLFLTRCYRHVDVVFIHHTDRAAEVDEETFFNSTVSGGTLVSSALEQMMEIVADRYPPDDWNIYVAQASDGDNMTRDKEKVVTLMSKAILPIAQYVAYLEVGRDGVPEPPLQIPEATNLWTTYAVIAEKHRHFVMRKVTHRGEIYPVFRDLFQPKGGQVR
ncbi:MAG TPA: YeaH/YhbH family protein [Sphingobium sp.]|uniref:YeaH/YhbH family protein n=1 Tax=Sphingobium sp. TaxID=1912891 RepID=UPI002ED5DF50